MKLLVVQPLSIPLLLYTHDLFTIIVLVQGTLEQSYLYMLLLAQWFSLDVCITRVVVTIIIVLKSPIAHITDNKSQSMDKISSVHCIPWHGNQHTSNVLDCRPCCKRWMWSCDVARIYLHIACCLVWEACTCNQLLFLRIHLVVGCKRKIGVRPSPITVWSLSKSYICPWNAHLLINSPLAHPLFNPQVVTPTTYICAV